MDRGMFGGRDGGRQMKRVDIASAKLNVVFRKLAQHTGGAVLQGRLIVEGGNRLTLAEAGFSCIDPRPKAEAGPEVAAGGGG
jgi:hypothetical protein